jgi:hypothetical protein
MTKKEACALLGISPRTLERRMTSGRYTFTRTGEGQFAELSFTHSDIGLPESSPVAVPPAESKPVHDVQIRPEYNDEPTERTFAERYLANEVPDSAGNYSDGSNPRWPTKGVQSLLGPIDAMPRVRPDTTAHMDPALIGDIATAPNPVDSDEYQELLHPGHADRIVAMYASAGVRQPSEQQRKQALDCRAISAAFRQGFSR